MFFTTGMAVLLSSVWLSNHLQITIKLSDAKDVESLKSEILSLQHDLSELQLKRSDLERKYINEMQLSSRYLDLLKDNGISWR